MKNFDPDQIFLDSVIDEDGYFFYVPSRLFWDEMKKGFDIVDVEELEEMDVDVDK